MAKAYFHSMMASSGPWIITITALGSFYLFAQGLAFNEDYIKFRLIIMFNFSVSLVIAAPIINCSTRYLADLIYLKQFKKVAGLMIGMLIILFCIAFPISSLYYLLFTEMDPAEKFQAMFNFMLIAAIWHAGIFTSALKYYKVLSISFFIGMALSVAAALHLASSYSLLGMLGGFNVGLAYILASLIALVFIEYPPFVENIFKVTSYIKEYWDIALGFFVYALGLWIDKWIMWFAPESVVLDNGMRMYPDYDSAMFISYITVIPSMAIFLLSQETTFYESYFIYYSDIQNHVNFEKIRLNHANLLEKVEYMGRNLIFLQLFICISSIMLAPYFFNLLGINFIEISMFRAGLLGAAFQILSMYIMVLLTYFDYRRGMMALQFLFFTTNCIFTLVSLWGGIAFYGYGFFLSSLVTFLASAVTLELYIRHLPYHTFVSMNIRKIHVEPQRLN